MAAAQRREPVPGSDLELLRAIPPRMPPPRRLPAPAETVAGLCAGVINSAERVRHLAWETSSRRASSPDLTINSLRRVAATSTLTSHHCEILLRALAERETAHRPGGHAAGLLQAAEAAGRTRQHWLGVAHALDRVTTDTRLHLSPDAAESGDLALWTGRLAYADPQWTLASGPGHQARPPQELVPRPEDARLLVTAVHHACETLTSLGYAEREQIRAAGAAPPDPGHHTIPARHDGHPAPVRPGTAGPDRFSAHTSFQPHARSAVTRIPVVEKHNPSSHEGLLYRIQSSGARIGSAALYSLDHDQRESRFLCQLVLRPFGKRAGGADLLSRYHLNDPPWLP